MTYVVGLTGGIGSGKTEVSRAFAELGADVADADAVAHAVSAKGEAGYRAVCEAFGAQCCGPDGELDRGWLRRRVFADPAQRVQLERLLHPLILARLDAEIGCWRGPYGLLSVPLLLERGTLLPRVARVLVVDCSEDEQVRRVMARNAIGEDEVRAIMATQLSRPQRLARADDVIDNAGPLDALAPQVLRLDTLYRKFARQRRALESAGASPDNELLRDQAVRK